MKHLLIFVVSCVLGAPAFAADAPAKKPNIIVVLVDDLGRMDLRCQGNQRLDTPNIDRLAAEGMRFTDAYAAAPVCSPTRAAILTGQSPARLRITTHITRGEFIPKGAVLSPAETLDHLPLEATTLAERLKEAGYATGFFGKWHLAGVPGKTGRGLEQFYPERRGFDVNLGGCAHGGPPSFFDPYGIHNLADRRQGEYLPDRLADETAAFIRANSAKPFFICWWDYAVHWPMQAPKELVAKYEKRSGRGLKNATYGAMVEALDTALGRVLSALKEAGISDHTLILFTSDNGGLDEVSDNRPLRAAKGFLYEGGIRVPLIVRWPGVVQPGTTCAAPVISTDLFPTVLQASGLAPKKDAPLDGESLLPLLRQSGKLARKSLCFHYPNYAFHSQNRLAGAIRRESYKLIENFDDGSLELYNLARDISETRNLVKDLPDKAAELARELHAWQKGVKAAMPVRREGSVPLQSSKDSTKPVNHPPPISKE